MFIFLEKFNFWLLMFVILALFLLTIFAAGQSITFSWLSGFPEQAERAETLYIKSRVYFIVAVLSAIFDVLVIVGTIKKINKKSKKDLEDSDNIIT